MGAKPDEPEEPEEERKHRYGIPGRSCPMIGDIMILDAICSIASIAAIIAAWYNGGDNQYKRRIGFLIWMVTNCTFAFLFLGVYFEWWVITVGLVPTILMYLAFFITSTRGAIVTTKQLTSNNITT